MLSSYPAILSAFSLCTPRFSCHLILFSGLAGLNRPPLVTSSLQLPLKLLPKLSCSYHILSRISTIVYGSIIVIAPSWQLSQSTPLVFVSYLAPRVDSLSPKLRNFQICCPITSAKKLLARIGAQVLVRRTKPTPLIA